MRQRSSPGVPPPVRSFAGCERGGLPRLGDGAGKGEEISPALPPRSLLPRRRVAVVVTTTRQSAFRELEQRASELEGWRDLRRSSSGRSPKRSTSTATSAPCSETAGPVHVVLRGTRARVLGAPCQDPQAMRRLLERSAKSQEERLPDYTGALVTRDSRSSGEKDERGDVHRLHQESRSGKNKRAARGGDRPQRRSDTLSNNDESLRAGRGGEDCCSGWWAKPPRAEAGTRERCEAAADRMVRALGDSRPPGSPRATVPGSSSNRDRHQASPRAIFRWPRADPAPCTIRKCQSRRTA